MAQRPDPQPALGEVIRERRIELNQTQEAVALAAGTDQARVSRIEDGDNPSFGLARRIAAALGWSLAELADRVEEREAAQKAADGEQPSRRRGEAKA